MINYIGRCFQQGSYFLCFSSSYKCAILLRLLLEGSQRRERHLKALKDNIHESKYYPSVFCWAMVFCHRLYEWKRFPRRKYWKQVSELCGSIFDVPFCIFWCTLHEWWTTFFGDALSPNRCATTLGHLSYVPYLALKSIKRVARCTC